MVFNFLCLEQVKAESEGMSNTIKGNKDSKNNAHHGFTPQPPQLGNNNAVLSASIGGMNSSGVLFNNSAMNPGVLPHTSMRPSISPVSIFLPRRPGIN